MKNRTIGRILLASLGVAILAAFVETEAPVLADNLYMVGGMGMIVFGTWGGLILTKLEDK